MSNVRVDMFVKAVLNSENLLMSSAPRGIGKTPTVNQVGYHLQALGYTVYVLTCHKDSRLVYYAHRQITTDIKYLHGYHGKKIAVIVDEHRYCEMLDLCKYCKQENIPIVGYVEWGIENEK